jgi:hypothetical protein
MRRISSCVTFPIWITSGSLKLLFAENGASEALIYSISWILSVCVLAESSKRAYLRLHTIPVTLSGHGRSPPKTDRGSGEVGPSGVKYPIFSPPTTIVPATAAPGAIAALGAGGRLR